MIPLKVLYCSCGKRLDISRTALVPEWIEAAWLDRHSGSGHARVDRETWSHIRTQQAHWAVEARMKAKQAVEQGSRKGASKGGSKE